MNLSSVLIAPCGMNCGICRAYLREKNKCPGCNSTDNNKPKHCLICRVKNCVKRKIKKNNYCYPCKKYPCPRLKQLDLRYKTKYHLSLLSNLNQIQEIGLEQFVKTENERWACPACDNPVCIHNKKCYSCGKQDKRE